MFGGATQCTKEIQQLKNEKVSLEREVGSYKCALELQLKAVEELKAINNYQTIPLEQEIEKLKELNNSLELQLSHFEKQTAEDAKELIALEVRIARLEIDLEKEEVKPTTFVIGAEKPKIQTKKGKK